MASTAVQYLAKSTKCHKVDPDSGWLLFIQRSCEEAEPLEPERADQQRHGEAISVVQEDREVDIDRVHQIDRWRRVFPDIWKQEPSSAGHHWIDAVTDHTLKAISENCGRLQGLNITDCSKVTDDSLVAVAENCHFLKRVGFTNI